MSVHACSRLTGVCAFWLVAAARLPAQQYWGDDAGKGALRITVLKSPVKGDGYQLLSGSVFLDGSARLGSTVRVEGDLPIARSGFALGSGPSESAIRIGNPYLGLRFHGEGQDVMGQIGIRIPLASDAGTSIDDLTNEIGGTTDFDRFEGFEPKVLTVRGAVELRHVTSGGFLVGLKAGPSVFVSTRSNIGDNQELFADYGARVGYQNSKLLATIGVTGRAWVTESHLSIGERTNHQLGIAAELRSGSVRPSFLIRFPLDPTARETTRPVFGAGLIVAF